MKLLDRWLDRRTMKRLRMEFEDFRKRSNFANHMPKEDAFKLFCRLEAMGEDAVRDMLNRDAIEELTAH